MMMWKFGQSKKRDGSRGSHRSGFLAAMFLVVALGSSLGSSAPVPEVEVALEAPASEAAMDAQGAEPRTHCPPFPSPFQWVCRDGDTMTGDLVMNNPANVRFTGANGVKFPGALLTGNPQLAYGPNLVCLDSGVGCPGNNDWRLTGNAGTVAGTNFLGTTDNTALEIKVNSQRVLRFEPKVGNRMNIIGGHPSNSVAAGVDAATIGGGGEAGNPNTVAGSYGTVAGGVRNSASGLYATVGGGAFNTASGREATVAGGILNTAAGGGSFAAGFAAQANHLGSFVWSDATTDNSGTNFASTADQQFSARARGGFRMFVSLFNAGCTMTAASPTWTCTSDINLKEGFRSVDVRDILHKVASLPLSYWNMKGAAEVQHIGPMSQDFYAAFGLGETDKGIGTVDADGVAFAAIQGLYQELQDERARNDALEARLAALEARLV